MIIATRPCGCLPKKEDPPCPPCCVPYQRRKSKSKVGCGPSKSLKSILSRPKVQEPGCCPIKPPEPEKVQVSKICSEITKRGLPYKELEAIINDNKLVIRTQTEPPLEEFDPPCDCTEDPRSKIVEEEKKQEQISDNRTLTLFPQTSNPTEEETGNNRKKVEGPPRPPKALEQNPNIFRLRVKKRTKDGQNIDLEFRTPRPWSAKMRQKHEEALLASVKPEEPEAKEDEDEVDAKKVKKRKRRRSRRRKKEDECGEILARPPCGNVKRRTSGNC
ncbi:uncharacterized protein LOC143357642 [Halictus rubicundus]|uniref:uncharacterized protein LOC143357642 n=1 Tax=Halictus rubicundus TaxID=77578 RepID=UPI004035FC95